MDLRVEVEVNAPAADAWRILGDCWEHIGLWAAPITASVLDGELCAGAVRTCQIARFGPVAPGVIKERLLEFDADARALAYETIAGMPGFIGRATNRWSVHARPGGTCVVRSHATVTLRGPLTLVEPILKRTFRSNGARVLEELRHRVETGRPHPRKVAAMKREGLGDDTAHPSQPVC
jgi:hypothetical protein